MVSLCLTSGYTATLFVTAVLYSKQWREHSINTNNGNEVTQQIQELHY